MIFSLPFWVSSIAISIIKTILSGAVGAIFAFYARHSHDRYANSIRWSRVGGLLETLPLLWNSRRQVPKQSSIAMASMILAGLFNMVVAIFLGAAVLPADRPVVLKPTGVLTTQLMSADSSFRLEWTTFMEPDATMKKTLISLLSDTQSRPDPIPQTEYVPHTYNYDIACNETAAAVAQDIHSFTLFYPHPSTVCMTTWALLSDGSFDLNLERASNMLISPGLYMVVAPVSYTYATRFPPDPQVSGYAIKNCTRTSTLRNPLFDTFPKDGIVAPPRTDLTRCQYESDDSIVMASTYIMFAINQLKDFDRITTSIFDDPTSLPLLTPMRTAINNGTFLNPTNNATMVMFTRISANVDFFVCMSTYLNRTNDMGLLCTYVLTSLISTKPQPWDPDMLKDIRLKPSPPIDDGIPISELNLNIRHMPPRSQDPMWKFSPAHLLQATTDAAEYIASLGHNIVTNQETGQLYILYETIVSKDAFEVPNALLIVLAIVVVTCLAIWVASEVRYPAVYNGSLYNVIFQGTSIDFQDDALGFEDDQESPFDEEKKPSQPSQEESMATLDNRSRDQLPA
ncbi:hypothetical protein F5H01DRAFT_394651 [Linnemannia elongata]|nr:hypothetical protein F5H01DRAFT_394651 [Linnemannia elongata]